MPNVGKWLGCGDSATTNRRLISTLWLVEFLKTLPILFHNCIRASRSLIDVTKFLFLQTTGMYKKVYVMRRLRQIAVM